MGRRHQYKRSYRSCFNRRRCRSSSDSSSHSRSRSHSGSRTLGKSRHSPRRAVSSSRISFKFRKQQWYNKRVTRRVPSSWDVPARGYEHLTPLQYKGMQASGQIASRIVPDAPQTAELASIATVTRQARRLYIGNIPFGVTDQEMMDFFNQQIRELKYGISSEKDCAVLSCQTNLEKNFAFLEFRSMEEATEAMNFDGLLFRGQMLKVRRPHDYHPVATVPGTGIAAAPSVPQLEILTQISSIVPDSMQKIYIGGLPTCLNEDQVKELVLSFGPLRGFNLVRETATGLSKGFAFCEFMDPTVTDIAIAGLNGMQLGDRKLNVQRSLGGGRGSSNQTSVPQVPGFPDTSSTEVPTQVLCLLNMVIAEELIDDDEYEDICTDIKEECNKYGIVQSLKVPRPMKDYVPPGVGKAYVHYNTELECQKALRSLSGRKFNGRVVVTSYYDLEKFRHNELA